MEASEAYKNLNLFTGMVYSACCLPVWGFGAQKPGQYYYSTCPNGRDFEAFMRINGSLSFFLSEERSMKKPVYFADKIGLSYVADYVWENEEPTLLVVLGPFFGSTSPLMDAERKLKKLDISVTMRHKMLLAFQEIPVISEEVLEQYVSMMHYCITGKIRRLSWQDLERPAANEAASAKHTIEDSFVEDEETSEAGRKLNERIHIGWILDAVRNGQLDFLENGFSSSQAPVTTAQRQFESEDRGRLEKDDAIMYIALCTQAAEDGGLLQQQVEDMRDNYVRRVEAVSNDVELFQVMRDLLYEAVTKVHDIKPHGERISKPIQSCCDYIHRHLTDEFSLSDLAAAVGYTDYYLTKKFYSEMGIRLNDYIKREKIALAKVLLITTDKSVQDIAVELNFSTRSFFTRVFKEEVGVSPAEFKERSRFQRTHGSAAETGSSGRRRRCSNM